MEFVRTATVAIRGRTSDSKRSKEVRIVRRRTAAMQCAPSAAPDQTLLSSAVAMPSRLPGSALWSRRPPAALKARRKLLGGRLRLPTRLIAQFLRVGLFLVRFTG
jgi:hypothetical protein